MNINKSFTWTFGLGLILIAAINLTINPFGLLQIFLKKDTQDEYLSTVNSRLVKPYLVNKFQPNLLILGDSSAAYSIDPNLLVNNDNDHSFNLAIPSANIKEITRLLEHAQSTRQIKRAVVGLSLATFNHQSELKPAFNQRLKVAGKNYYLPITINDLFSTLFSWGATKASYFELTKQSDPTFVKFNGHSLYRRASANEAMIKRFNQHIRAIYKTYYREIDVNEQSLELIINSEFARLLDFAYTNNIQLDLFISPFHIFNLILHEKIGLTDQFSILKKLIVDKVATKAADHNQKPFNVWDFSGYNSVTTEGIADISERSTMENYWDVTHYKSHIGAWVICRILQQKKSTCNPPEDFGIKVDNQNISEHLSKLELKKRSFLLKYQSDLEFNTDLVFENFKK